MLSFPVSAPVDSTLILWGATCWEERAQIPRIFALLPYWVFVCVWCESLQTADLNNTVAAGCQETWKGVKMEPGQWAACRRGSYAHHSGTPQFSSSLSWRNHLQHVSLLYLSLPRSVLADLVFCSKNPPPPRQGMGRRQSRGGYVVIYLSQCIKNPALSFECAGSTTYISN